MWWVRAQALEPDTQVQIPALPPTNDPGAGSLTFLCLGFSSVKRREQEYLIHGAAVWDRVSFWVQNA